ncbi:uncharacterized protein LOC143201579 [Rhynchophorus ferrugineus]|uniref:Uncharacterized protein n=1 Tax=Rhynchophorus ferrugineus TaxID=354439 RepID=A0A834I0B2_RHYFE|nr:hypothetical protein GWI33_016863 [Rhynchophorus ferrugineus]
MSCRFHDVNDKILEIKKCETEADVAWNSFRQDLIDCISGIELLKCKLKLISENNNNTNNNNDILLSDFKEGAPKSLSEKASILNNNLQISIRKNSMSIRRSFLAYNNLVSQHELLFLPYFEMKEYYKQLQDFAKSEVLTKEKLSYGEALEDLMFLSKDIQETKTRSEKLQDNSGIQHP